MSWNYRPNSCPLEKLAYLLWKLRFSSSKHLFYYHQISAWQLSWLLLLAGSSSTETLLFKQKYRTHNLIVYQDVSFRVETFLDFSILPSAEERHGRYLLKILPAVFLSNLLSNCQLHYAGMDGTTTSKAAASVHGEPGSLVILVVGRYSKPIGIQSILGIQSKIVTQQLKSCSYKFYGCFNPKIIFRNTRL